MAQGKFSKEELIEQLVREFRVSGNQDDAFDRLAAERLGLSETDLHCVNLVENGGGLTAGELATQSGLTTGAVTGVVDRLERAGYARRAPDPSDRRRVQIEVTPRFYERAREIWGPVREEWGEMLNAGFTASELEQAIRFLRSVNELTERHIARLAGD